MSQSQYNQTKTLTTENTAYAVEVPLYYERVIVTNESSGEVFVATNGSAVSTSQGDFGAVVMPGAWRMVGNDQPRQPLVSIDSPGSTVQNTGYQGATEPNLNPLASGYPTYVSLMGTVDGAAVVLEFV